MGPPIPDSKPPGGRQKLSDKAIQDEAAAEAGERRWQALQVEAERVVKGQKGWWWWWCVCEAQQVHTLRPAVDAPLGSLSPPGFLREEALCLCVSIYTHRHTLRWHICICTASSSRWPPVSLRSSSQPPPCMVPGLPPLHLGWMAVTREKVVIGCHM